MSVRYGRPLVILALLLSSCSCSRTSHLSTTPSDYQFTQEIRNQADSVKAVLYTSEGKTYLVGSAVVVRCQPGRPILLITNYHVVDAIFTEDPKAQVLVGSKKEEVYQAVKVSREDIANDLALLEGKRPEPTSCPSVPLAKQLPLLGSPVWAIGNPLGFEKNVSYGVLSHVFKRNSSLLYRTDAAVAPGNSGGGLFNNKGELIGITNAMQMMPAGLFGRVPVPGGSVAIALPHLYDLLR